MRTLPILTLTMGSILVLISQIAFGESVAINLAQNKCIFLDPEDPNNTYEVYSPDKIKAVQSSKLLLPLRATCKDASITTEGSRPIYFEGTKEDTSNHCVIATSSGFAMADYSQKSDKKGTTLTCHRN